MRPSLAWLAFTIASPHAFGQNHTHAPKKTTPIVIDIYRREPGVAWTVNNQSKDLPGVKALLVGWRKAGDRSRVILRPHLRIDFETWLTTVAVLKEAGYLKIRTHLPVEGVDSSYREVTLGPVEKEARDRGLMTIPNIPTVPTH